MKHKRSDYDKTIRKAMIEHDIDRNELSDCCGYNGGANLMTGFKNGTVGDKYHVDICEKLKLDLGEILKLKLESKYDSSK